jgi:hypothetical protein
MGVPPNFHNFSRIFHYRWIMINHDLGIPHLWKHPHDCGCCWGTLTQIVQFWDSGWSGQEANHRVLSLEDVGIVFPAIAVIGRLHIFRTLLYFGCFRGVQTMVTMLKTRPQTSKHPIGIPQKNRGVPGWISPCFSHWMLHPSLFDQVLVA